MITQLTHLVRTQFLGLIALLLVLTGGAAYAATAAKNSVTSKSIKDGQVKTVDVRDGAITGAKLGSGSVTAGKVAAGAIGGGALADGSVTTSKISDGSVSGADIADGAVSGADIADGAVSGADIADGSVGAGDVGNDSVGAAALKVSHVVVSGGTPVGAGATAAGSVSCPSGELLTGGGHSWQINTATTRMNYSSPQLVNDTRTWEVEGTSSVANTLYAWAVCLPG